jgi:hypothetical protein
LRLVVGVVVGGLAFVGIWMYFSIQFFTWWGSEPVIKYTTTVPNPPGDGTILENLSIKVGNSSAHDHDTIY